MAPVQRFAQHRHHEPAEDQQRDRLLRDLELPCGPAMGKSDAIGRDRKTIFDQRDAPADQDDHNERLGHSAFQVPIPGDGHEEV